MVVLRVRFKCVTNLNLNFLEKTDLSVPMINIFIRTVKTMIYLNEQFFVFQELHANFSKKIMPAVPTLGVKLHVIRYTLYVLDTDIV